MSKGWTVDWATCLRQPSLGFFQGLAEFQDTRPQSAAFFQPLLESRLSLPEEVTAKPSQVRGDLHGREDSSEAVNEPSVRQITLFLSMFFRWGDQASERIRNMLQFTRNEKAEWNINPWLSSLRVFLQRQLSPHREEPSPHKGKWCQVPLHQAPRYTLFIIVSQNQTSLSYLASGCSGAKRV